MSQWRKIAIEQVPSCKRLIEQSNSPMAMWIELHSALEKAYDPKIPDEATISQIYNYALWCWYKSENDDLATAVACAFFEHLPQGKKVCRDLHNRISHRDFESLDDVFRYHMTEEEFEQFKSRFFGYPSKKEKKALK